jgi:hypothetical protein
MADEESVQNHGTSQAMQAAMSAFGPLAAHSPPTPRSKDLNGPSKLQRTKYPNSSTSRECSRHSAPGVTRRSTLDPPETYKTFGSGSVVSKGTSM